MRLDISKDWCLRMAELETDTVAAAGTLSLDPQIEERASTENEAHGAFSRFVNLMRRSKKLSVEQLADDADIEIGEILEIEGNPLHKPEIRTVYQLSNYFDVPRPKMLQIAGITSSRGNIMEQAVRFAARSETFVELSPEEQSALHEFVRALNQP